MNHAARPRFSFFRFFKLKLFELPFAINRGLPLQEIEWNQQLRPYLPGWITSFAF
jgi:hypothetical protein